MLSANLANPANQTNQAMAASTATVYPPETAERESLYAQYKVIRRNGAVVGFEPPKIVIAMTIALILQLKAQLGIDNRVLRASALDGSGAKADLLASLGKQIFDEEGDLVPAIRVVKGSGSGDHEVDGLSGATLTANGVNNMLQDYLTCYEKYLLKNQSSVN